MLFVFGLLTMALLSGLFGAAVFPYAWPAILLWVTTLLAWFMRDEQQIWLLIPTGVMGSLSLLLSFSALTNYWDHWAFSWTLLVMGILLSVYAAIRLAVRPDRRAYAYRLGRVLARIALILSGLLIFASLFR